MRCQVFSFQRFHVRGGWPVTWWIIAINVFWFVVIQSIFGHDTYAGAARAGAMVNAFVTHGQWYRLLSALFVHFSITHILVNMISLWTLTVVETLVGSNVLLVIYLLSGLVGNVLSLYFIGPFVVSAGASGAIFGLFGSMLAMSFLRILPPVVRNQLLIILAINVVLDITNHNIDWLAHLGGMIAGTLLTLIYTRVFRRPFVWKIVAWILVAVTALCLLIALFTALPTGF